MKAYRIRTNGREIYKARKDWKILKVLIYSFDAGFLLAYLLLHMFLLG